VSEDLETQLREALALQTATSEVLRLISENPGDLGAVMHGIVVQAAALCDAHSGSVQRIVGDEFEFIALSTEGGQFLLGTRVPRVWVASDGPTFITDIHATIDGPIVSNARSLLTVPLHTPAGPFGGLTVTRLTVDPFEERHGKILQAFADQAAVAISNAGLFNALQETTDELRDLNQHLSERVDEKVREVERLNTLRRFVSPQLAEAIASGAEGILNSHRREITVLFCDLRGFTSFAETAEPEEVMAVLREFHHAVGPMIFEHHGTIAQFTGDGMLVFFNDPVQLDDPAWEAVQLAVRMRDRTGELSQSWRRRGHELTLGIGIAVGFATCGEIGFEGRTEYTAIGTVVNLAARICGIANGEQILVTNRVHAAVEDRVAANALGDHEFKGLSRPVPLFEVTSSDAVTDPQRLGNLW
jgi:class 3 adenylate cyclase